MATVKQIQQDMKKRLGWKWYLIQFKLLFDFTHQYEMWMMRRHLYHVKKVNYWCDRIKRYHGED